MRETVGETGQLVFEITNKLFRFPQCTRDVKFYSSGAVIELNIREYAFVLYMNKIWFFNQNMMCLKPLITYIMTFIITWDLKYSQYTTDCYFGHVSRGQHKDHSIFKHTHKRAHHWNTYTVTVTQTPIVLVFVHSLDEAWLQKFVVNTFRFMRHFFRIGLLKQNLQTLLIMGKINSLSGEPLLIVQQSSMLV